MSPRIPDPARRAAPAAAAALLLLLGLGPACSTGGGGDAFRFQVVTVKLAVPGGTPALISGRLVAFLGDEATNESDPNLNGDPDAVDQVAHVVNLFSKVLQNLGVAVHTLTTDPMFWVGDRLFLVVDEVEDGFDWSGDTLADDLVLLTWKASDGAGLAGVRFVAELDRAGLRKVVAVGTRLFYASADAPALAGETNLRAVDAGAPFSPPTAIGSTDAVNPLRARVIAAKEGLVLLALAEADNAVDLNGDLDATDLVLALLDGLAPPGTALARSTGLAVPAEDAPCDARAKSPGDWLVAFLVSEADQDGTSLNDPPDFSPNWLPVSCGPTHRDEDANDDVVFYLHFVLWDADPTINPPRNTGIAAADRVVIDRGFVAAVAPEQSDGEASLGGPCDLNDDGDDVDRVVRWIEAVEDPLAFLVLPAGADTQMRALFDCPGGTHGLVEFRGGIVSVVDEAADGRDHNLDGNFTSTLVGDLVTGPGAAWDFLHASGGYIGASWLNEKRERDELLIAVTEDVFNGSLNGDSDQLDSFPAYVDVAQGGLVFPGVARAVKADNAGVVLAGGYMLYRVDEAADNAFWNSDADKMDQVLLRTFIGNGPHSLIATLNDLPRDAVDVGPEPAPFGAAFLSSESKIGAGQDLNGDGDMTDVVLRYFRF